MIRRVGATLLLAIATVGCSGSDAAEPADGLSAADQQVNDALFGCLTDAGFDVSRSESGEIRFATTGDESDVAYADAEATCRQQLVDEGLLAATSTDDIRAEYALATTLHRCLVAVDFPLIEMLSEADYVENYDTVNILESTSPVDLDAARAACPAEFTALEDR